MQTKILICECGEKFIYPEDLKKHSKETKHSIYDEQTYGFASEESEEQELIECDTCNKEIKEEVFYEDELGMPMCNKCNDKALEESKKDKKK